MDNLLSVRDRFVVIIYVNRNVFTLPVYFLTLIDYISLTMVVPVIAVVVIQNTFEAAVVGRVWCNQ
ncbi:hypothetical protein EVB81_077 [Rhizobium phage RHph_I46]|uniref:Transmembrane protein n=1 Tax=Rhizobium phage RHph_I1_9 TaxID=2509729 RepID=A0A7S5R9N2_9CAUD|nr:hypothetical protein PP936_gp076 [Rhizobium phage RHph_I1_9]QIG69646.1 hypothetical protein EVB81_077 [Rhizobium phage RHph_I46]QIG70927.1 hypothetical protein EVB92_077 [Rhizobium phage RHph_I9]QIG73513.1 hypothetical protein EVC04_076 [Rhizobium phage RHph_I1_9]QIG76266.1 hypothetical protein EVC25_077 [Rhizobium phage RHph_I34]